MPITRADLTRAIQRRCARVAVAASTVRGQGARGIVEAAREFLADLPLRRFGTSDPGEFRKQLNHATRQLKRKVPPAARSWGLSRKVVNIFLRDALYNFCLRAEFHLDRAEALLELPLDSITVKHLKRRTVGRGRLPRWRGVKHLRPAESRRFQTEASAAAEERGIARVHLDAIWWTERD